jgi:hypothetical protein
MEWSRSETLTLAKATCAHCQGTGVRFQGRHKSESPCCCVYRNIFRACYRRFRDCVLDKGRISPVSLDWSVASEGKRFYSRKVEEYIADFCTVSRRALDNEQYRLFRLHYLLGADWKLCARHFRLDRGSFFHRIYEVEAILGRTFRELRPFGLYPLREYFNCVIPKGPKPARRKIGADLPGIPRIPIRVPVSDPALLRIA